MVRAPMRVARRALLAWCALTLLLLVSLAGLWLWRAGDGFELAIQRGPISNLPVTLAAAAMTWLLGGSFLLLLSSGKLDAQNALAWTGFFLVAMVYLNLLRERPEYGDIEYYTRAAFDLAAGNPLPPQYFYPPLWAALLAWLTPLGEDGLFLAVWLFNLLGLLTFYFLLGRLLERYGFPSSLAALATTVFMLANAPLLRTMVYMQVNLHVLNAVFLSLLLFRRSPALSALAMAMAVHLKASPAALVLAFLLAWDLRWLAWAALWMLVVGLLPAAGFGFSPYLDFFHNALGLAAGHGLSFRETSFDGLFTALGEFLNLAPALVRIGVYTCKAALLAAALWVMRRNVQRETFVSGSDARPYNAFPSLLILMTLASPIVWEHHGVFVGLSFLLLLKKLDSPSEWALFGFAYFFEFLLPTFDLFPWSYGRLVAPLVVLGLTWKVAGRGDDSPLFERARRWLAKIPRF
ncbi:MAG: glycosyltransferase family 87 protein [Chloroflexota bacterium]